ncbi:hypothetical protein CG435_23455 [Pantoea ananatis]|uniref:hypothetical protein n=1 Tax=Pantoea ananas TaxID=553 RepID=UPI000CF440BD|nr:hypothetical protein [Pantoea ananatis]MDF7789572.1 hypothetical protein [Pantoea ananatis]PQK94675.1 hypothetical protein CG435_23455 [Pantoea ananatis]
MSFTSALNNFAQGVDPTVTRLVLGDFEFLDFEVPERLALPGRQKTVLHQMVGGKRVIDVLGVEYDPLTWSGVFTGYQAGDRVKALERMRDAGKELTLTLDDYSFTVVITSFVPVYEFIYRRSYTIEVAIVASNASPLRVDALTGALQGLLDSDIGQALGLSDVIDVSTVTTAVTKVQSAVKQVNDFAHATVEQVQSVVRPVIAAQVTVQQQITQLESAANDITSLGGLVPGNPISKTVSNLLSQADQSTRIPALYSLQNVLGRLNKNVSSGQTADGIRSVTLSGGNLYQVASDQYGDASLWSSIASANGLTDPQLTGINTLTIPSNPTS